MINKIGIGILIAKFKVIYLLIKYYLLFQLFINNEFVDSVSGKKFPTINPTNEKKIIDVSEGDKVSSNHVIT